MKTQALIELLRRAHTEARPFWVRGYTSADGNVTDFLLEFPPRPANGASVYDDAMQRSLRMLQDTPEAVLELACAALRSKAIPTVEDYMPGWRLAIADLIAAYDRRMQKRADNISPVPVDEVIVPHHALFNAARDQVTLTMLRSRQEVTQLIMKSKVVDPHSPAWLEKLLPLGQLQGRLNLVPGKYLTVQLA